MANIIRPRRVKITWGKNKLFVVDARRKILIPEILKEGKRR